MASAADLLKVPESAEAVRAAIERFLSEAAEPALTEDGAGLFALGEGNWALDESHGRLVVQAWNEGHNLARQITGIESEQPGRLALRVERFGKRDGILRLVDLSRLPARQLHRQSARFELRESFRLFLRRWYSGYRLVELTTGAALTASLSPNFPRAFLRTGSEGWAAIAAPDDPLLTDQVLSFGLIWLDYLRRHEPKCSIRGLILWLPGGGERTTCLRLRYMDPDKAAYRVWTYAPEGMDQPIDPADYGNLDTEVEPCPGASAQSLPGPGHPELRLEAQVRASLRRLDADLLPDPVYGQVPTFAATAHGLIDLLAADATGRLSVIELKAAEDIHLPMQALDYWMRVRWHLERGDFARGGYFPGIGLRREPPRLLLVAPALLFHPSNEVVLRYFSPEVPVERIGTGIEWQKSLQVLFRAPSPCR